MTEGGKRGRKRVQYSLEGIRTVNQEKYKRILPGRDSNRSVGERADRDGVDVELALVRAEHARAGRVVLGRAAGLAELGVGRGYGILIEVSQKIIGGGEERRKERKGKEGEGQRFGRLCLLSSLKETLRMMKS